MRHSCGNRGRCRLKAAFRWGTERRLQAAAASDTLMTYYKTFWRLRYFVAFSVWFAARKKIKHRVLDDSARSSYQWMNDPNKHNNKGKYDQKKEGHSRIGSKTKAQT